MKYLGFNLNSSKLMIVCLVSLVLLSSCNRVPNIDKVNPDGHLGLSDYSIVAVDHQADNSNNTAAHNKNEENVLPVFPGAQGFGTRTIAGRGGAVCVVSNLSDNGPGSFRNCAEDDGRRVVVFNTGGIIEAKTPIEIRHPFISVYGQTATGDGITIRASQDSGQSPLNIMTHDVLIQHLRIRAGSANHTTCCRDALRIGNKAPGKVFNVVIDHNSLSWGTDQIASAWFDTNRITFSYNIISESLHDNGSNEGGPGGRGLLIGSKGAHSISIHHNLFAHSYERNPMVITSGVVDIVNNLVFHWVSRGGEQDSTHDGQQVNWVKNYFIGLKNNQTNFGQGTSYGWGDILLTHRDSQAREFIYLEGNLGKHRKFPWDAETKILFTDYLTPYDEKLEYHSKERFLAPQIESVNAKDLYKSLHSYVGATLPVRDSIDSRVISELFKKEGKMPNCIGHDDKNEKRCENNVGGWPSYSSGEPRIDTDLDGMPDNWEIQHGLNPNLNDASEDLNGDGYTNIEHWVHAIR